MILQDLQQRARQKTEVRLDVIGATDVEQILIKEMENSGWKTNFREGDFEQSIPAAVDAAVKGETDLLFCSGADCLTLVRALDRSMPKENKPLTILQGFELPSYSKMLWVGFSPLARYDVIPEAVKGVNAMIKTMNALGEAEPKISLLSCVESISAGVPSTLWEATLGHMGLRGQFGKAKVDGPLAFDLAVSPAACADKNFKSEIGGQTDVIIPPDLNSYSSLVDIIHFTGPHEAVGLIIGGPCPIVLSLHGTEEHLATSLHVASLLV